jgi:hypothetical protein
LSLEGHGKQRRVERRGEFCPSRDPGTAEMGGRTKRRKRVRDEGFGEALIIYYCFAATWPEGRHPFGHHQAIKDSKSMQNVPHSNRITMYYYIKNNIIDLPCSAITLIIFVEPPFIPSPPFCTAWRFPPTSKGF